jgi:hypothetical protein
MLVITELLRNPHRFVVLRLIRVVQVALDSCRRALRGSANVCHVL